MSKFSRLGDARIGLAISIVVLAATQLYLVPKVVDTSDGLDFRLIWLAGTVWGEGVSPYSEIFDWRYEEIFGVGPTSHFWVYPPYWWVISRPLALLPFETALLIWNLINYSAVILSAYVFTRLPLVKLEPLSATIRFAAILSALSVVQATPFALSLGQTSFLMLAGISLLLLSLTKQSQVLVAFGLALVMLKPNFGAFVLVFLIGVRWAWQPALIVVLVYAVVFTLVAGLTGLHETSTGFVKNLSEYDAPEIEPGQSSNLTGIVHIFDWFRLDVSKIAIYIFTAILGLTVSRIVQNKFTGLLCFAVFCSFLVPLHTYDMTFSVFLLVVLSFLSNQIGVLFGTASIILLLRPENVARLLGFVNPESMDAFAGSLLVSIALSLGCITAFLKCAREMPTPQRAI